jgi:hypothetical protein
MRKLKRWLRSRYADFRVRGRAEAIAAELQGVFAADIRLVTVGSAGRDSIYRIDGAGGERLAMMRLANPHKRRSPLPSDSPFVWLEDGERFEREWQAYTVGAPAGLTPRPLWRTEDALVCEYLPWRPLHDRFREDPSRFWDYLCHATRCIARLHRLGLVHMDASLANILADDGLTAGACIDFEYAPAGFLSAPQQRAYDYLRLLESCIKFCDQQVRRGHAPWIDLLGEVVDPETAAADIAPLLPAIGRTAADAGLRGALRSVFVRF